MPGKTTRAFLDRYEGGFAVLLLGPDGDRAINVPRDLLPEDTPEGSALALTLAVDEDATRAGRAEVARLMDELLDRSE